MRPRYLSLAEVARLTGRHPELLRQWCAAGRLPCERIGSSWALLDEHVPLVQAQPARGHRARSSVASRAERRVVVAAAFGDAARGRLVRSEVVDRLGLEPDDVAIAPLALDGLEIALVAGRFPESRAPEVAELMLGLGGRIVADGERPWAPLHVAAPGAASGSTLSSGSARIPSNRAAR